MCKEPTTEQLQEIYKLNEGDKVLLTNGDVAEFVRAKQKKFIGIIKGARYDIPMSMYKETVETKKEKTTEDILEELKKEDEKNQENKRLIHSLKKDDWFYINKSGKALAFKFVEIKNNKIIGINPIGNEITKIDMNFEIGLIK